MRLKPNQNDGWGLRAGIGGASLDGTDDLGNSASVDIISFPLAVNYLVGKKRSSFETGFGITPLYTAVDAKIDNGLFSGDGLTVVGFLTAGYRFQPIKRGVAFRVAWTPAVSSGGFSPAWFGLSLGYSFK